MLRQFQISLLVATLALLLVACGTTGTPLPPGPTQAGTEPTPAEVAGTEPTATPTGERATQVAQVEPTATAPVEPTATQIPEAAPTAAPDPLPGEIRLPPGFKIGYYAQNVPNARSMALSPNGTLFVGTRQAGVLYAVIDHDQDHRADEVLTLARGMNSPNGVAVRDGALYVAEINRILRYDNIEASLPDLPEPVVINDDYPSDGHHGWKFILIRQEYNLV